MADGFNQRKCPMKGNCLTDRVLKNLLLSFKGESEKPLHEISATRSWLHKNYCNTKDYVLCEGYKPSKNRK